MLGKAKTCTSKAKHHVDLSVSGSDPTVAYNLVVSSQCSEHHRDNEIPCICHYRFFQLVSSVGITSGLTMQFTSNDAV